MADNTGIMTEQTAGHQPQPAVPSSAATMSMSPPAAEQQPPAQQLMQPAVSVMSQQHLFHFQGISVAEAMRQNAHMGLPRPEAFGFVAPQCGLSSYVNSKKNRKNENKAPWTKDEDEKVQTRAKRKIQARRSASKTYNHKPVCAHMPKGRPLRVRLCDHRTYMHTYTRTHMHSDYTLMCVRIC